MIALNNFVLFKTKISWIHYPLNIFFLLSNNIGMTQSHNRINDYTINT